MAANRQAAIVIRLLLVTLLIFAAGCTSKQEKIQNFISKGDSLMEKGDPVRAALEYRNALQLDPKNGKAALKLSRAYLAQKEFRKAYSALAMALDSDPGLDEARVEKAALLVMARQADEALKELDQIKDPDKFPNRIAALKANALIIQGKHKEALEVLKQAPEKDRQIYSLLAVCLKEMGRYDEMRQAVEKWKQLDPKSPAPYLFMAKFAAEKGDKEEAARQLSLMTGKNPADTRLKLLQARLLEGLGMKEKAAEIYEKLPDESATLKAKANFYIRIGRLSDAEKALRKAISLDEKDVDSAVKLAGLLALTNRSAEALKILDEMEGQDLGKEDREKVLTAKAEILANEGRLDEAQELCEQILEKNQGAHRAHLLLGKILLAKRQFDSAEVHLNQAAAAEPENEEAQLLLANCQLLNKKQATAGDTLKSALKRNPSSQKLRMALVKYYFIRGERDKGLEVLEKGLELDPKNPLFLKSAGEVAVSLKRYDQAEKFFQRLISSLPDKPIGFLEMGRLMLVQNRHDEAIKWFQKAYQLENGWQVAVPAMIDAYVRKKDVDSALALVRKEVEKRPKSAQMHYFLAKVLELKQDRKGAEKAYKKAIELAPRWTEPYRGLALVYLRQGRIDEAVREMEGLYSKTKSLGTGLNLAILYEYSGQYEKAAQVYKSLMERFGKQPIVCNNLAYIYAEYSNDPKELEEAGRLVSEALLKAPENPSFLDTAGWLEYKLGNLDAAWTHLQKAVQSAPENGVILLHCAVLAHEKGLNDLALEYLDRAAQQRLDPRTRQKALELKERLQKKGA